MLVLILLGFSSNAYAVAGDDFGKIKVNKVRYGESALTDGTVYIVPADSVATTFWANSSFEAKQSALSKCFNISKRTEQDDKEKAQYHQDNVKVGEGTFQLKGNTQYAWYVIVFNSNQIKESSQYYISEVLNNKKTENVTSNPKLPKLDFDLNKKEHPSSDLKNWYNVTPLPKPTFTFDDAMYKWFDGTKPFTISGTVSHGNVVDSVLVGDKKAEMRDTTGIGENIKKWSYTFDKANENNSKSSSKDVRVKAFNNNKELSDTSYYFKVDNTAPTITDITFNNAYKKTVAQVDSFFFKKGAADAQVKATVTDKLSGVDTITFDEKPYTSATFVDLATAEAGMNVALFHAEDSVGHVKDTCITYFVDGTAPVLTVGEYLNKWTVKSFKIGVNAKDNTAEFESGLDSIAYVIDNAEPVKYTDSITIEENTVVNFKAVDKVGNTKGEMVTITNILLPSILVNTATDKVGDKYTHCTGDLSAIDSTDTFYVVKNVMPKEDSVAIKLGQTVLYNDHFYKLTKENTTDLVLQVVAGEVITVNVGAVGYATVYSSHNLIVPKGVTVAAYASVNKNEEFQESTVFTAGEVLPGGFGYVVIASPGSYDFVVTNQVHKVVDLKNFNCLKGSDTEITTPTGNVYVLDRHNGVVGFYKYDKSKHSTVGAHKAYYQGKDE